MGAKRITGFRKVRRRRSRFEVCFDKGESIEVDADVVVKLKLSKGMEVDDLLCDEIEREDERIRARRAAMRLLAIRPRTRRELFCGLARRFYNEEVIEEVVRNLDEEGRINEREYAGRFIRDRIKLKPSGPRKLRVELRERGVGKEIIEESMSKYYGAEKQREVALGLLRRKFARLKSCEGARERQELKEFLYKQGFEEACIYEVMQSLDEGIRWN
jgi:regulatory protein